MLAASEIAVQFGLVVSAVFALVGAVLKVIEKNVGAALAYAAVSILALVAACLLYTSPSPRD